MERISEVWNYFCERTERDGESLCDAMAARRFFLVRYRPISGVEPERTLAMIWHKHQYQNPLVKGLIQIVRREAERRAA